MELTDLVDVCRAGRDVHAPVEPGAVAGDAEEAGLAAGGQGLLGQGQGTEESSSSGQDQHFGRNEECARSRV